MQTNYSFRQQSSMAFTRGERHDILRNPPSALCLTITLACAAIAHGVPEGRAMNGLSSNVRVVLLAYELLFRMLARAYAGAHMDLD